MVLEEEEEVGGGIHVKTVILRKGADSQGIDHDQVGEIRPPPPEAYIVLRPHRVPRIADLDGKVSGVGVGGGMGLGLGMGMGTTKGKGKYGKSIGAGVSRKGEVDVGWDDGVPGDIPTFEQWSVFAFGLPFDRSTLTFDSTRSYELEVLQSPTRGRALGLYPLSRVRRFFLDSPAGLICTTVADVGAGIGFSIAFRAIDCSAHCTRWIRRDHTRRVRLFFFPFSPFNSFPSSREGLAVYG